MRDEADIRLLRFAELAQRLERALPTETFGEMDVRTAVALLANHGLVRPLKFGDLVLLRPDVLNGYAGAIVRAARTHRDEIGCVSEAAIFDEEFDFTGVHRLTHRPDEELLLNALVQTLLDHSLCIRESEGGEWLLIFPSQYRREREIPRHPAVLVSYSFTGEPQTIYATLVVRLWNSRTFGKKELWRNAAEFTTSKGHTAGVVFEKAGEGRGRLSIFFDAPIPDEMKVVFIEFVHRHLEKYAHELRRERHYTCTNPACGRQFIDRDLIEELLAEGRTRIICQKCHTEVELLDHVEQYLGSELVTRKVAAMNQRAAVELDKHLHDHILVGHMQAVCSEANQLYRDGQGGIDGVVEFKNDEGEPSGKHVYVQFTSGGWRVRRRQSDKRLMLFIRDPQWLAKWMNQPADIYVVSRRSSKSGRSVIRWMNVTRHFKNADETSLEMPFEGERLDAAAIWRVRDQFFPRAGRQTARAI
jgi:hypothetical protein